MWDNSEQGMARTSDAWRWRNCEGKTCSCSLNKALSPRAKVVGLRLLILGQGLWMDGWQAGWEAFPKPETLRVPPTVRNHQNPVKDEDLAFRV